MLLRYALTAAVVLCAAGLGVAQAQSPFPPVNGQQASPFPPAGQASPFPPVGAQASPFPPVGAQASPFPPVGQPQQQPACMDKFLPLRQEVDKRFEAAKVALTRKAGAGEMCRLLTRFGEAETKMIKYVETNTVACGFPANAMASMKAGHVKTAEYKQKACEAAAAPRPSRPAEPTLSDAFAPPAVSGSNTRTGRGTLDTLSGNPLAR